MTNIAAIAAALALTFAQTAAPARQPRTNAGQQTNNAQGANVDLDALAVQVMLDRAGFSPGVIDGRTGANTQEALALYQRQGGAAEPSNPLTTYMITADDVAAPFVERIPSDLVQQVSLPSLGYTNVVEMLAERFHSTPALLQRLNPDARFAAGDQIQVPNVEPLVMPVSKPELTPEALAAAKNEARATGTSGREGVATAEVNTVLQRPDVLVTVSRTTSALTVEDTPGHVIFAAPVTTGSQHDPLPIGQWKVLGMQLNPTFNYNPDLFWDADPSHSKAKIPSGPNNPVGLVWIALSKEHYGIHGTPEPSTIGRTESHGCVRMTNWDALKLAGLVKPGTKVIFTN
jgi:lipoprotein-anchoring transpeptidase ErfK/SrfK